MTLGHWDHHTAHAYTMLLTILREGVCLNWGLQELFPTKSQESFRYFIRQKKNLETTRWLDYEHWIWNWLALCHSAGIFFVNFSQHPRSRQMICQWYGPWEFGCTIHGHHGENGPDNHGIFEQMCFFLSLFHDVSLFLTIFSLNSGAKCREDELRHLNLLGLREFPIHGQHHQSVAAWLGWVAFF